MTFGHAFLALVGALIVAACSRPTAEVGPSPPGFAQSDAPDATTPTVFDAEFLARPPPVGTPRTPPKNDGTETRCGWLDNPTPGNWWLVDRHGSWEIGVQGGYRADGIDRIPDFGERWQITNAGSHGFGCACLRVKVDAPTKRVRTIEHVTVLPLQRCRDDEHLEQRNR